MKKCKSIGIDIAKQMIPVAPAAIIVVVVLKQMNGEEHPSIFYMPAAMCINRITWRHRLASNSLLEALVFGHRCYL